MFGEVTIRLPELNKDEFWLNYSKIDFPIRILNPLKKHKKDKLKRDEPVSEDDFKPVLTMKIWDLTMATSYMAFHENRNVFEDRVRQKTYSTKKY